MIDVNFCTVAKFVGLGFLFVESISVSKIPIATCLQQIDVDSSVVTMR
jgi:hypothetical protein